MKIKNALSQFWRGHSSCLEILAVDEICLGQGRTRADLVLVTDKLVGIEIKGPRDSLSRLTRQLTDYRSVFDEIYLAIGLKHLNGVLPEIPSWCGVLLLSEVGGNVDIDVLRPAQKNYDQCRLALSQLLWRDEALEFLKRHSQARGVLSKPRRFIWQRLAERFPSSELSCVVRNCFLNRGSKWRKNLAREVTGNLHVEAGGVLR